MWLSRGVPRPLFLSAKFTAILLPAALMILIPLGIGGLVSAVFTLILQGGIPFHEVDWGRLGLNVVLYSYSLLPYAGLAFLLAVASRSTIVAIGGGLAYSLIFENIAINLLGTFLGGVWAEVGAYLPGGLVRGLMTLTSGIGDEAGVSSNFSSVILKPGVAAIGIGLTILGFVGVAILIFRRQDLSA